MREGLLVRLTADPLDPTEALAFAADPSAGGTVLFSGTVRDHSTAGEVTRLEYEAWDERALQGLEAIGEELFGSWPVRKVAILHRVGRLEIGDDAVVIAVASPHLSLIHI